MSDQSPRLVTVPDERWNFADRFLLRGSRPDWNAVSFPSSASGQAKDFVSYSVPRSGRWDIAAPVFQQKKSMKQFCENRIKST
jgi:hypothetical protein